MQKVLNKLPKEHLRVKKGILNLDKIGFIRIRFKNSNQEGPKQNDKQANSPSECWFFADN